MSSVFRIIVFVALLFLISCNSDGDARTKGVNERVVPINVDSLKPSTVAIINSIDPDLMNSSLEKLRDTLDYILFDGLSLDQKLDIYKVYANDDFKIDAPISESLYYDILNPIDGMKGVVHRGLECTEAIQNLFTEHRDTFSDPDKFFIYSSYARYKNNSLIISPNGEDSTLGNLLIDELKRFHKTEYDSLMSENSIQSEQDLLNKYFVDKWTVVKAIGYRNKLIIDSMYLGRNGEPIRTKFDVGAVCPPICPKLR